MKRDIEELLESYFEQERRKVDSRSLQNQIASQTFRKNVFRWHKFVIPVAGMLLLAFGYSLWTATQQQENKTKIAQSQILYEDDDFVIYVQN